MTDLVCFSHLRWDFVFQRPQHLLTRAARTARVIYWEEAIWLEHTTIHLRTRRTPEGVLVVQPVLPWNTDPDPALRILLDTLLMEQEFRDPILWYYTPHALAFSAHLDGAPTIYDCMDELSAFAGADPALPRLEQDLLRRSKLVFTGGYSLFEAKRGHHRAVHPFPSGVDAAHFRPARTSLPEPVAQRHIPWPRAGFYGVIDERLDRDLLAAVADLRPGVSFILLGPIAKLDWEELPQRPNLHYLGPALYDALPAHLAHWQAALMPFALNAATRYISPTKTPEYLAAGRPVVSTPIADVVRQYGGTRFVAIAATAEEFAAALDSALALDTSWWPEADVMLGAMEWDSTWSRMEALIQAA